MERPMRILAFSSDKVASSWQRILLPFHWMHKLGIAEIRWGERETDDAFTWSDICVFQRWYAGRTHHWFRTMRLYGVRLVYELDDDCWRIERDNPFQSFYAREQLDAMEDMVRAAALVTVPSRGLAEAMAPRNRNRAVTPNGGGPGAGGPRPVRDAGRPRHRRLPGAAAREPVQPRQVQHQVGRGLGHRRLHGGRRRGHLRRADPRRRERPARGRRAAGGGGAR